MNVRLVTLLILPILFWGNGIALPPHNTASDKSHSSNKSNSKNRPTLKIMAKGKLSPETLNSFLIRNNSEVDAAMLRRLVKTYIIEANREGVNYEVAFCQMCLETGFLKFEGSVSKYQHNYCGLGCVDLYSGGDWFSSMEEGVRAHVQHLKAYASHEPVRGPLVDPRFNNVKRGTVTEITGLTGTWAMDPDYGHKLLALINRLHTL